MPVLRSGTRGGIRTHTVQILNLSSPAGWTMRACRTDLTVCLFSLKLSILLEDGDRRECLPYVDVVPAEGFEPTLSSS